MQNLPPELIYQIADEIDMGLRKPPPKRVYSFVCDRAETLSSLSLVCRRLRSVIEPVLFEKVTYNLDPDFRIHGQDKSRLRNPLAQYPCAVAHVR